MCILTGWMVAAINSNHVLVLGVIALRADFADALVTCSRLNGRDQFALALVMTDHAFRAAAILRLVNDVLLVGGLCVTAHL
jgi:hypothetical protein